MGTDKQAKNDSVQFKWLIAWNSGCCRNILEDPLMVTDHRDADLLLSITQMFATS